MTEDNEIKSLIWIGNAKTDYMTFPKSVTSDMGAALYLVQIGLMPSGAKPLKGFGGAGVLELRESDERRNSYRTVYSVKFDDAVYVLHAFQKKSKRGAATPKQEIDLVKGRLKLAEADYRKRKKSNG